jgi:molybdopterin molybdotransferase
MPDPLTSPAPAADAELTVEAARAAISAAIARHPPPAGGPESAPLAQALGRVLAEDVISPLDVPAHDNAAMDGYAFAAGAWQAAAPAPLRCIGAVRAGAPHAGALAAGQCLRIMTGAVMPAGCDTVAPLEQCRRDGDRIHIDPGAVRPGAHRRRRGEDLARGSVALRAGRWLRPADLGLAASLGLATLPLRPRLRVAVFSTGDELRAPGQALAPGCIYDSNRHSLQAALQRLGMEVLDLGLVCDDPHTLRATLRRAAAEADAVLTSGGVSVGDADHTRALLADLGEVAFWKVAMRPGRPFAFGSLRGEAGRRAWLFALPGNPVAALVSFYALVRDGLLQRAGATPLPLPTLPVRAAGPIRKRPGRAEFARVVVEPAPDGGWHARLTGDQGSGILRSLGEANALALLPAAQGDVAAGEWVAVCLFDGLV